MRISDHLSAAELRSLTCTSNARALWVVAINFALVGAGFALPALAPHPLAWLAASLLLASRAMGLAILTHDTAHLAFFKTRRLNEWAGTWLFGGCVNLAYLDYRRTHLAHHRAAGTDKDPDRVFVHGFPASRASLTRKILRDVGGVNGTKNIAFQLRHVSLPFVTSHALMFGILALCGVPQVYACWWLGQLLFYPLVLRLRVMSEHGGVADLNSDDTRRNTGTLLAGPLTRLFITPNRVNYHVEHHMSAAVPSYRLPDMHAMLAARGFYEGQTCLAPSLFAVLRRCLK